MKILLALDYKAEQSFGEAQAIATIKDLILIVRFLLCESVSSVHALRGRAPQIPTRIATLVKRQVHGAYCSQIPVPLPTNGNFSRTLTGRIPRFHSTTQIVNPLPWRTNSSAGSP
jgi:hypothetical protein